MNSAKILKNTCSDYLEVATLQVKLEGDISHGVALYKKALYYNWHYADAMYNLGVAYGEMLKFDMVIENKIHGQVYPYNAERQIILIMLAANLR